jgi:hypothetical protein
VAQMPATCAAEHAPLVIVICGASLPANSHLHGRIKGDHLRSRMMNCPFGNTCTGDMTMTEEECKAYLKWLEDRTKAARRINPKTAEVTWIYSGRHYPSTVTPSVRDGCYQVGREYYARSPGSEEWVRFGFLPQKTLDALWAMHSSKLLPPKQR